MHLDAHLVLYLAVVTAVALLGFFWLNFKVSSFKEERISRIKQLVRDQPETVSPYPTDVLSDKEEKRKKRRIVRGVRSRFTIIQRGLFALVAVLWIMALSAPFIGKLPTTMLSILVAVSTAVVGIAARPLVENMICGIVISFSNQLRVGDTLMVDQQYGTVEDISITHTKIKTWDWKRYVIPNSRMLTKEFINLTLNDSLLWAYLEFSVSYEADLDQVREIAVGAAQKSEFCTGEEPPQFWIMRLEKECVVCWVAAWADTPADAWNLKSDIAINVIKAFQEHGVSTHLSRLDLGDPETLNRVRGGKS